MKYKHWSIFSNSAGPRFLISDKNDIGLQSMVHITVRYTYISLGHFFTFFYSFANTNSRKGSVNCYKPYQYIFVPYYRWFHL